MLEDKRRKHEFKKELESLINKYSLENESDTPDFILADYLIRCLEAFNISHKSVDKWFDIKHFNNVIVEAKDANNI